MPVSFHPAKHLAKSVSVSKDHLQQKSDEILQSSLEDLLGQPVIPRPNGFVNTIVDAYNQHHALSLRPDDVWIAILAQFNLYVNANAEMLRSTFVLHEGKELVVEAVGTRYTVDFGQMAKAMTEELRKNINDPSLVEWILPKFSTTSNNDIVVSAVLMMSIMKKYFSYEFRLRCGIPKVTLEGDKEDWEELLRRIEKLKEFGEQPTWWYNLLHPVLSRFVRAFDDPDSEENIEFWQKIVHWQSMSSDDILSGWVTAFCVWGTEGKWLGYKPEQERPKMSNETFLAHSWNGVLSLDGADYHRVGSSKIPPAYGDVDVKLDDNGEIFDTMMVSGLIGTLVCDSNDTQLSESGLRDVVKPLPGWRIFIKQTENEEDKYQRKKLKKGRIAQKPL